ncbi:complex I NDUFA12 subunit family protein [Pleurotus pulmonarius]
MSFFRRLWNMVGINKSTRFVGGDLEGNRYYEWANPNNPSRTRRSVKYYKEDDMWLYVGGQKRLAVQWSSWLSHTRAHPPTIEELQADVLRQQKVQHNAALIEAKEQHEREEALRIGGGVPPAISDSDHRAEAHATHDVIDPQHLTVNGSGEPRPNGSEQVDDTIPWTPQSKRSPV